MRFIIIYSYKHATCSGSYFSFLDPFIEFILATMEWFSEV